MDYKILIVDGDSKAVDSIRKPLVEAGYEVVSCDTAAAAPAMLTEHKPHLVMIEAAICDGSGIRLCRDLNATEEGLTTPMVLFGGLEIAEQAASLPVGECGWDQLIDKNVDSEQLVIICRELLGDTRPQTTEERNAAIDAAADALDEAAPAPDETSSIADQTDAALNGGKTLLPSEEVSSAMGALESIIDDGTVDEAEVPEIVDAKSGGDFSHVLQEMQQEPAGDPKSIDLPPLPAEEPQSDLASAEAELSDDVGQDIDSHLESLFNDGLPPAEAPIEPSLPLPVSDDAEAETISAVEAQPVIETEDATVTEPAGATVVDPVEETEAKPAPWSPAAQVSFPDLPARKPSRSWMVAAGIGFVVVFGGITLLMIGGGGDDSGSGGNTEVAQAGTLGEINMMQAPEPMKPPAFLEETETPEPTETAAVEEPKPAPTKKPVKVAEKPVRTVAAVQPKPEPRKPEPKKPEPKKPEPKPTVVESKPVIAEPIRTEPVRTEPVEIIATPVVEAPAVVEIEPVIEAEPEVASVPEPEPFVEPEPEIVESPPVVAEPVLTEPILVKRVDPEIPPRSLKRGQRAVIVLKVLVDENGRIGRVLVEEGQSGSPLEAAAISAVLRWRYEPATEDGVSIRSWALARFVFER
ncbi:MAG: TonB family protein [Acidobacteriota bacterium]|nr:TonB family protein [Acidobacteriota bacterium]